MNLSNDVVIHKCRNGVQYLQFKKLLEYSNFINHAYSFGLDMDFRNINCYKNICKEIGSRYIDVVKPNQQHTKEVKVVDKKYNIGEPDANLDEYINTDGLITNRKNILLATTNADCILLLFFDPVKKVIANVHSGWRGTLQEISVETVRMMKEQFKCEPKDIICCICPSIRKCHFEVEKDVKDLFYNKFKDLKEINTIIEETKKDFKWNIDTVFINKIILKKEGLLPENIVDCGICSVCNSELIHSYRVENQKYKLETALIELKQ